MAWRRIFSDCCRSWGPGVGVSIVDAIFGFWGVSGGLEGRYGRFVWGLVVGTMGVVSLEA